MKKKKIDDLILSQMSNEERERERKSFFLSSGFLNRKAKTKGKGKGKSFKQNNFVEERKEK